MTREEVWVRAYCAVIRRGGVPLGRAQEVAGRAVADFARAFPTEEEKERRQAAAKHADEYPIL